MEIVYLGRSAFRVRGKDVMVLTDPYELSETAKTSKVTADIVTLSRRDAGELSLDSVAGVPRVVSGPGEYEVAEVLIAGVATSMQPGCGPKNTAYVLRFDDLAICHLGWAQGELNDQQVEALGNVDVLFLPVGGGDALGPAQAAEVVSQLAPSVVVPMNFRENGADGAELEPVDGFIHEMGSKEFTPEAKLTVTKGSLPTETRVVVLESRRG